MKKLLVGSVFAPTERNPKWIELQLGYLRRTVQSFDHAVVLNRVAPSLFPESTVIPVRRFQSRRGRLGRKLDGLGERCFGWAAWTEHSWSLQYVMNHFRASPEYENYLILDSDAFPFMYGWLDRLLEMMAPRSGAPEKQFAAIVRTDNLDTFPHPCAFFIKGGFARRAAFNFRPRRYRTLAGRQEADVGAGISPFFRRTHVFLPLLRTNVWNAHPILSGIYGGMFYHHGAGSRALSIRVLNEGYHDHIVNAAAHARIEHELYSELCDDPDRLLRKLAGLHSHDGHGEPEQPRNCAAPSERSNAVVADC